MDISTTIILLATLLVVSVTDLRSRRIPNIIVFPAMVLGIALNAVFHGLSGLGLATLGLAVGMAVFIPLYILGGMGAGDVKLMGAVGAFLGPKGVFISFLFTAVIGGIYGLLVLAWYRRQRANWARHKEIAEVQGKGAGVTGVSRIGTAVDAIWGAVLFAPVYLTRYKSFIQLKNDLAPYSLDSAKNAASEGNGSGFPPKPRTRYALAISAGTLLYLIAEFYGYQFI